MATRDASGGLDHPTVVPENFEADEEDTEAPDQTREDGRAGGDRCGR